MSKRAEPHQTATQCYTKEAWARHHQQPTSITVAHKHAQDARRSFSTKIVPSPLKVCMQTWQPGLQFVVVCPATTAHCSLFIEETFLFTVRDELRAIVCSAEPAGNVQAATNSSNTARRAAVG